jgi:hypothetical protein
MISDPADVRTIRDQAEALHKAQLEIEQLKRQESHREMCLKAEVVARNAANVELAQQVDILEKGLNQAKAELKALRMAAWRGEENETLGQALEPLRRKGGETPSETPEAT